MLVQAACTAGELERQDPAPAPDRVHLAQVRGPGQEAPWPQMRNRRSRKKSAFCQVVK